MRNWHEGSYRFLSLGFLVFMLVSSSWAQQVASSQESSDATHEGSSLDFVLEENPFDVALPIWVPGFRGSFAYGGISHLPVNGSPDVGGRVSDSELSIEFYLIGQLRFQHGRFFLQADGFNAVLGSDLTFLDKDRLEIQGTIKGTILRGLAGYRFYTRTDPDRYLRWSLDAYAGARHYALHIYTDRREILDIEPSWTDPIIGLSVPVVFKKWIFNGQLDFGGFGVKNRRSWYAHVGARYRFSKLFSLGAGWAFLDFEGEKDIDLKTMFLGMQLTGPMVTVQFSF